MSSALTEKTLPKQEKSSCQGTLYSIATEQEEHSIYLYTPLSESFPIASERFLRMHECSFAAGGHAGRFLRAQKGLEVMLHNPPKVEFYYNLDLRGILRVLYYPSPSYCILRFEGAWFNFINQQSRRSKVLYAVPIKAKVSRIMELSEHLERIKVLEHFLTQKESPARFKEYMAFVAQCRALIGGAYV